MIADNKRLFHLGTILKVTKLPVVRIMLAQALSFDDVPGLIWRSKGKIAVKNINFTRTYYYEYEKMLVLDIISNSNTKETVFHIHCPFEFEFEKYEGNLFCSSLLSSDEKQKTKELLNKLDIDLNNLQIYFSSEKSDINVIIIDEKVLGKNDKLKCNCVANPNYIYTNFKLGDVFEIQDRKKFSGNKISKNIFENYYRIDTD